MINFEANCEKFLKRFQIDFDEILYQKGLTVSNHYGIC